MLNRLPAVVWLLIVFVSGAAAQFKAIKNANFTRRTEIRKFNFLNAFYEAGCEGEKVRVRNGHYKPREGGDGPYFEFDVSVSFGDLTGDKNEEALVLTECSGAVQNYDEGKIYTVKNHRLVKLAELEVGAKNRGSIFGAKIDGGRVIVKRGPDFKRCTQIDGAAEETTVFRFVRGKLKLAGQPRCRSIE